MTAYEKRGYLNSDFRLFHLKDTPAQEIDYHYHDFNKVILFLQGQVQYFIEGRSYLLEPYDVILVNEGELHRPVIDPETDYERIIIYLSPDFLTSSETDGYDLNRCFLRARQRRSGVLRTRSAQTGPLFHSIRALEDACHDSGYAAALRRRLLFLEFMVQLNRADDQSRLEYLSDSRCSPKILALLSYINSHLTEPLDIDSLTGVCYLSRYHMMRLFKETTGCSIGAYITNKRLIMARELIRSRGRELSLTQICFECGFQNYSAFFRAYRRFFGQAPRCDGRDGDGVSLLYHE